MFHLVIDNPTFFAFNSPRMYTNIKIMRIRRRSIYIYVYVNILLRVNLMYYGQRKKRNIQYNPSKQVYSIFPDEEETDLPEEMEMEEEQIEYESEESEESYELEVEELKQDFEKEVLMIDGNHFVPKSQQKKQSFSDNHVRITTYFEKNVHQIIKMLQEQGQIESITKFVNDSIKAHLLNEYNDRSNQ